MQWHLPAKLVASRGFASTHYHGSMVCSIDGLMGDFCDSF
jgi:hypothetical protein